MGYKNIENALATVIKLLAAYDTTNVSQGDYRILGSGKTLAIVLQPGAIFDRIVFAAPRRIHTTWIVKLELYIGFKGEIATVADDLRVKRQDILDHVDKYPTLNGQAGVVNAFITGGDEPQILPSDPMRWWREILTVQIIEGATVTIAE